MSEENYSVLMSVYYKERPEYLRESMDSIYAQTIPTNDFVLICDGPLNEALDSVIEEMQEKFGERLHVYRLEKNVGLGNALNVGIKYCKNELVARMDSDDISRTSRCERQLKVFSSHPEYSVVSGLIEEFVTDIEHVKTRRVIPENNDKIQEFAKMRNPFNHPCVMYKKSHVEEAGGYQDFFLLEDYFLWVRMLEKGYVGYNIQSPLLWMRSGLEQYARRGGIKYVKSQLRLFYYMKSKGFINWKEFAVAIGTRGIASILPNEMRGYLYRVFLRQIINS